jgi:RNA polymerase sigma-70 factor (ECF subfamily)
VLASGTSTPTHLAGVARGDAGAMDACIEAHGVLVWSIVLKRVRDRMAAEDLTQEIFTEIWKTAGRYDPAIASESGFIAMIARRRAIDWTRKQQRLPEMECLGEKADFPAPCEDPGVAMDRDSLWKALETLPDETRKLFTLHFEQGLTHSEIAESTGLPLGSVKTRLRRGLLEARALLGRLGGRLNPNQARS